MDLTNLKRKIDGFRAANGTIQQLSPELLWELRQAWENFPGPMEHFRSEMGMKVGTLRKLLVESKKLNHVFASAASLDLGVTESEGIPLPAHPESGKILELIFDQGQKLIRFPDVETLVEFLRKAS